jgi:hypothetical protein
MGMKCVIVHVDRLVLRGLPHEDRDAMAMAVRERLEQTFGSRETVQQLGMLGNVPRLTLSGIGARPAKDMKR